MKKHINIPVRQTFRKYRYNLAAYLLLVFTLFITLRITYSFFYIDFSDGKYTLSDHLVSCMRSIADAIVISLPFYLSGKKHKIFFFFILSVVELMLLSCIWYYRNFETVIPYTAFLMPGNLDGLGPSILASVRFKDLLVVLPGLLYTGCYYGFLTRKTVEIPLKMRLAGAAVCLFFAVPVQINAGWNNYASCESRIHTFRHYGPFHVFRFDLLKHKACTASELEEIKTFIIRNRENPEIHPTPAKNLILILTESLTSWPVGLTLNQEEITPCLNNLIKQNSTVYFPHVLPQTSDGRSSDAQLIINTGLLPLKTGAAAMLFGINEFYSIPKALACKGYHSYNYICDQASYWNQCTTSKSYGFDKLFDKHELGNTGNNLNDKQLLEAVSTRLAQIKTPFYAQIVTLSTHYPYQESTCLNPNKAILEGGLPSREVAYFLAAVQYTDRQIGLFIKKLKETGIYDQSIILITGDHEDITFNQFNGSEQTSLADRYVPLIILNSPRCPDQQDAVIGQIDLYPTILDLMGADDYAFTGVGNSIFERVDGCAVFRTGKVAGSNTLRDVIARKKLCWRISDLILRSDYFKTNKP